MKKKRILKIAAIVLATAIFLPLLVILGGRGVYAAKLHIRGGVQERIFVTLGGIEQQIHIRGENAGNPVIVWLHGGPGWSDAYELAPWQYKMENDYTFIRWDQRGSGRTYYRSPGAPLSLDIMVSDVDELVDYAVERFGQPVYIVGDSWGSQLGITYASRHPEKIAGFVRVGQHLDKAESERIAIETACERAIAAGNTEDAAEMRAVYERIRNKSVLGADFNFDDYVLIQQLPARYLAPRYESQGFGVIFSPWFGFSEIKELMTIFMFNNNLLFDRNRPLFHEVETFVPPGRLDVQAAFIQGSEDYICNTSLVAEYCGRLEAPSKEMFIIEGAGHSPYSPQPEAFAEKLSEALAGFHR